MRTKLPKHFRPQCSFYKRCVPGLDVPSVFLDNIQGIDENLYLVWHQYKLLWDNFINQDSGMIEDSRYLINVEYGHLNFGHVLVNRHEEPLLEQTDYDKEWNPNRGRHPPPSLTQMHNNILTKIKGLSAAHDA